MDAVRMASRTVRRGGTVSIVGVYGMPYDNFPLGQMFDKGITLKMGQARNKLVLFRDAGLELLCWWHSLPYPKLLAAAMGLQNARGALQAVTEAGARCAPRT
jgi:threonine dehydrogenase-like Zn-dependent dehydrogenase